MLTAKTKERITVPLYYLNSNKEMEMLRMYLDLDKNNRNQVK